MIKIVLFIYLFIYFIFFQNQVFCYIELYKKYYKYKWRFKWDDFTCTTESIHQTRQKISKILDKTLDIIHLSLINHHVGKC